MNPSHSVYDSPRLAAGYAFHRPPVHARIIQRIQDRLQPATRFRCALDVGCGAGLSTAALEPLAERRVGIEPAQAMLAHHRAVAPQAQFVVGQAERLPFADASFDLLTAAGAINYADRTLFLPEAARVLTSDGLLVIYDFSGGRKARGNTRLQEWGAVFEQHYPSLPGYALDVRTLTWSQAGFRFDLYEEFQVAVPMNAAEYLAYALSETNVEAALSRGEAEADIRAWCEHSLAQVFGGETEDVLFDAYFAVVRKNGSNPDY